MHEALFHKELGFYSKGPGIGTQGGTFNTSAMYPVFAWSLAQAVEQAENRLGEPRNKVLGWRGQQKKKEEP